MENTQFLWGIVIDISMAVNIINHWDLKGFMNIDID
jgi:hypothetical protein